ncbi:uncharacterized mitochondrial protein AtMg00860-like [Salvia splendens]|uniref:uncharacterized mitochondrial protein AtMg00860-like n=1 Tax=Salvia splendens TaxID=180675 RepID=UPI001C275D88|nr:uncharacterized mitochondrial protein AtMg00860-like [Salvia splendens]
MVPKKSGIQVVKNEKNELVPTRKDHFPLPLIEQMLERFMYIQKIKEIEFSPVRLACHLDVVLRRCQEKNLVLNFEKCHFMVPEGIVLGHVVSERGIQVDKAKVDVISKLRYPTNQREVRGFLGHAGFCWRFIRDFAKIAQPLTRLLQNDVDFVFDEACQGAFQLLKDKLVPTPIIKAPDCTRSR